MPGNPTHWKGSPIPEHEERFVENDLGEVATCDCGGVNLTMGAFTVHIARDEVHELFDLIGAAVELVEGAGERPPKPRPGRAKPQSSLH